MSLRDVLLSLLVIVIWGGNIVAIKIGVNQAEPLTFITLRFALTTLVFLPFIKWPGWDVAKKIAEISFYMCVLHQGFLFVAMKMMDASTMAILLQSQILFATLLGWWLLAEKIGWRTWGGIALGFAGLLVTLKGPDVAGHPLGFAITMACTIALAFSYIRMRQLKSVHPATFIALTNGFAVPFVLIASLIIAPTGWAQVAETDWTQLGGAIGYQVVLVSLSHILWQALLSRNEVAKVTCFILLMPVVAIILSAMMLGEHIDQSLVIGGALTLSGVGIIALRKAQKAQPIETDPVL
ncbi:DMT family transporter [Micavibrio aeruginosavorus]|uniref:EamA domain-containing protein n=1 Tax=Micavibrio aeruginosavorus (strain ARL-13) TaxID=856793 RepID=G2KS89_MICAA|nr:EamA family transporter [Micavibrio aeruginosavorus]AEP08772.1 conserved hypothetical protein [Micavibrio aeruginosavorus ARL-13]